MKKDIVLIGGGGHCKSCIDVIEYIDKFNIAGIVDIPEKIGQKILGYEIIACDKDLPLLIKDFSYFLIAIGQIKSSEKRVSLFETLKKMGAAFPVIISPFAHVSKHSAIDEGTIIMHKAIVNAGSRVGHNCVINTMSLIEHDAVVGDNCHIATGAVVNGGVQIDNQAFIGSNSVVIENICIGQRCVIGAGEIIKRNIDSDTFINSNSKIMKQTDNIPVFIIAEAGVNHNGSIKHAKKLIDAAIEAKADAVKFQTFKAEKIISKNAPKANYQKDTTGEVESQLEMVKKLELDVSAHEELLSYSKQKNIMFLSTPFDLESIDLLASFGLEIFKIPSGEITNLPYLRKIGKLGLRVILSTGMSDLGEIEDALDILVQSGTKIENITVLHCNTEYPTPMQDVNLRAMQTIGAAFPGVHFGYSDHTEGIEIPIAAVAMGATVIEKHFTLDKNLPGPDHRASLEPHELVEMVRAIRNVELAFGDGIKRASGSELKNKPVARKSIVAGCFIKKGEIFGPENLAAKRPGNGISPMLWDEVVGKIANRDFNEDDFIEI